MRAAQRKKKQKRRRIIIAITVSLAIFLAIGGTATALFGHYGAPLANIFGFGQEPQDYEGEGHDEAQILVQPGDTGAAIGVKLEEAGVIKSAEFFTQMLVQRYPEAVFDVGTYKLRLEMSSEAAYEALQDHSNKLTGRVTIPEGYTYQTVLELLSGATEIPLAEFETAAADPQALGIPAEFPTVEGFLFPATYEFEPNDTAETILRKMVERMRVALNEHGVSEQDTFRILTMAALVQREAGANADDYPKIARVFYNRLESGMLLQSDATVAYGTGRLDTVWTTPEERADASNKYNTYANPGLPIGPIGMPGDVAIDAAVNPAEGDWLFFVPINLETGETRFAATQEEHDANARLLAEWCEAHRAEGGKRCD